MKKILFFSLGAILLLSSCKQNQKEIEEAQLVNDSLTQLLVKKDSSLYVLINTVSAVEANLQTIKEKEKIISLTANDNMETITSKEKQINNDIQTIYSLLEENRKKISQLEKQLRNARVNEKQLKNTIESLNQRLIEKDAEILELQQKLSEMNIEIAGLSRRIEEMNQIDAENKEKIKIKDQTLQTAYFIIGTSKELKEMGIMDKGKLLRKEINKDFNKEHFTQVNILKDTIINFSNRKVEILTVHPSSSYNMNGEEIIESIEIKDPWEFWSVSKYLVAVVK